jgi:hypothetical protein
MKKHLFTLVAVLTLFSAGSAWGQTRSFRANVPFAFNIGQQTFPAGSYQFQSLLGKPASNCELGMLAIRNLDGRPLYKVVFTGLLRPLGDPQPKSKLVFGMRDGRHYLSQIWIAEDGVGHRMPDVSQNLVLVAAANEEVILDAMQLRMTQ